MNLKNNISIQNKCEKVSQMARIIAWNFAARDFPAFIFDEAYFWTFGKKTFQEHKLFSSYNSDALTFYF